MSGQRASIAELQVRGNARPDELAAVLAVLSRSASGAEPEVDGYPRWRWTRLAAIRRERT